MFDFTLASDLNEWKKKEKEKGLDWAKNNWVFYLSVNPI